MKKISILYWVFTIIFGGFMLFSALPNIMASSQAVDFVSRQLGYPAYFIPFIGVAKALGAIAIVLPGFPRIKEWAYAGLMFDLAGAMYSLHAVGRTFAEWGFILLVVLIGALSYIYYHKKISLAAGGKQ